MSLVVCFKIPDILPASWDADARKDENVSLLSKIVADEVPIQGQILRKVNTHSTGRGEVNTLKMVHIIMLTALEMPWYLLRNHT